MKLKFELVDKARKEEWNKLEWNKSLIERKLRLKLNDPQFESARFVSARFSFFRQIKRQIEPTNLPQQHSSLNSIQFNPSIFFLDFISWLTSDFWLQIWSQKWISNQTKNNETEWLMKFYYELASQARKKSEPKVERAEFSSQWMKAFANNPNSFHALN